MSRRRQETVWRLKLGDARCHGAVVVRDGDVLPPRFPPFVATIRGRSKTSRVQRHARFHAVDQAIAWLMREKDRLLRTGWVTDDESS